MGKKVILVTSLLVITIMSTFVFANVKFEAYDSDIKIYYNDKEVKFKLPIVIINGNTYIPIKEAAEKLKIKTMWDEERKRVFLDENTYGFKIDKMFKNLYEIELPEGTEILNYDYVIEDNKQCLITKILLNKKDVEDLKAYLEKEKWEEINNWNSFSIYAEKYEWWDLLSIEETINAYKMVIPGIQKETVEKIFFIAEKDLQYYLYTVYS